jgi:hypothetical protein
MAGLLRGETIKKLAQIVSGLQQNPTGHPTIIDGQSYTDAELIARVEVSLNAEQKVETLRTDLNDARKAAERTELFEAPFLSAVRSLIHGRYKSSSQTLDQFGLEPPRSKGKRTAEQRALMAAKNRATRLKRGTLGKRQRLAIKGDVTGVEIRVLTKEDETKTEDE